MKEYSIFDIVGPIMIGPSSSHTAGACRISYIARNIIKKGIVEVVFVLYGSFAKTYKGHGTDVALLGGILGMKPDDERIKTAFRHADESGLKYTFETTEDESDHPNTVLVKAMDDEGEEWQIVGASIGGGKAVIKSINGIDVEYTGEYHTLITYHMDTPGMLTKITSELSEHSINIANMKLFREGKGETAICIIETDEMIPNDVITNLKLLKEMRYVNVIEKMYE